MQSLNTNSKDLIVRKNENQKLENYRGSKIGPFF